MKSGALIAIGVFALSVIGAAVAATAYFKHKQSIIFDEYEEELAGDLEYYSANVDEVSAKETDTKANEEIVEVDEELVELEREIAEEELKKEENKK